jgi:hypothetical protein
MGRKPTKEKEIGEKVKRLKSFGAVGHFKRANIISRKKPRGKK